MIEEPILILHGINNHQPGPFHEQVCQLQKKMPHGKRLIPVDWGEFGGQSTDLSDCLPVFKGGEWDVRSEPESSSMSREGVLAMTGGGEMLDNKSRADLVSQEVASNVRSASGADYFKVHQQVTLQLASTRVLQYIDDQETFAIVGKTINSLVEQFPAEQRTVSDLGPGEYEVRGFNELLPGLDAARILLDQITRISAQVIEMTDATLGRFVGNQLGRLNQTMRARLAMPISGTLGDIMSYQRSPAAIQARLRMAIAEHAPGYGTENKPITILAHSLGGVIAFDAAVNPAREEDRLWINSFLTFGSQSAFFHIVDPRVPALQRYKRDAPVTLPSSILHWTNLWDPIDLLAFTAGTVFRMANGTAPLDIAVQDTAAKLISERGWAHSVYWQSEELQVAIERIFSEAVPS